MADGQLDLDGPFAILFEDTLRRLDRIERELQDVEDRYTGVVENQSYLAFTEALQLAANALRQLVLEERELFTDLKPGPTRQSSYWSLGATASTIDPQLDRHLPELTMERPKELEVLTVPLTRLAKRIVKNVELLFFPWPFDGYRTEVYGADSVKVADARLEANLKRVFGADIKFVKLWHPTTRECDVFHHAVFAHELGHIAIYEQVPLEALETEDKPLSGEELPTYATVAYDTLDLPPGVNEDQRQRLFSWFRELACDVFAMRFIGPAFAVAFAEVTSPNRPIEPSGRSAGDHPPSHIRFRVLREEIERYFPEGSERRLVNAFTDAYLSAADTQSGEKEIPGAEDWLTPALAKFRRYLAHLLGDAEFTPAMLRGDLDLVRRLSEREVPSAERIVAVEKPPEPQEPAMPEEWSRPIDWRSTLNGVLIWHLAKTDFPTVDDAAAGPEHEKRNAERRKHRDLAIRLAVGGIELSEFHIRATYLRERFEHMRIDDDELQGWVTR